MKLSEARGVTACPWCGCYFDYDSGDELDLTEQEWDELAVKETQEVKCVGCKVDAL